MKTILITTGLAVILGLGAIWLHAQQQFHGGPSVDDRVAPNSHPFAAQPSCQPRGYATNELLLSFTTTGATVGVPSLQLATQVALDNKGKVLDCVPAAGVCDLWVPSYTPEALDAIIARVNSSQQLQAAGVKATRNYLGGGF